ncbi:hypothetical protein M011DRAFT_113093 [Sporormia fimetaria CBS 119925]|uniref:PCI domain-containing protein n=1 Tax=Sporormia fimetaria CBS 119925 TaxID=1340428 RepID=A0A6A6VQA4_9PLEO|nr:hypothetical protein M011DRAFT_113093 [Sporormia fimetaria CBS 119925]
MEQTRALNALEPFLLLSKSANSPRAAADLITQATSAPNTYVFTELLQTPNIQSLRNSSEYSNYLTLLEIFAWGTWQEYKSHANLPQLTPQQHQKLLLLSLLPLSHSHTTLTYASLCTSLDLPSPAALEHLVTTAIYSGLLSATLDPSHAIVTVTSVAPLRDLAPGSIPQLQNTLSAWAARCEDALKELEKRVKQVKAEALVREKRRRMREQAEMVAYEDKSQGAKKGMTEGGDAMELDDVPGQRTTRSSRKLGGFGMHGLGRRLG